MGTPAELAPKQGEIERAKTPDEALTLAVQALKASGISNQEIRDKVKGALASADESEEK